MTHTESLMLAVCFGAAIGNIVGNIIVLIEFAVDDYKRKKRRRQEEAKATQQSAE